MLRLRFAAFAGQLNERLAACQAASRALGVVPGGGWRGEKSAFKILILAKGCSHQQLNFFAVSYG